MEKALYKSIYYKVENEYNNYEIITEISYDGTKKDLIDKIGGFKNNLNIRKIFNNDDNICYTIFNEIGRNYDKLLLNQVNSILIITRYDQVIKLYDNTNKNETLGIIKIDSVIAELNIERSYKSSWFSFVIIGSILFAIGFYNCKTR